MKPTQIKIWPELIGSIPGQIAFYTGKEPSNELLLDLSNCTEVNSTGLTFTLIRILKLLEKDKHVVQWEHNEPTDNRIKEKIENLAFWKILYKYKNQNKLFDINKVVRDSYDVNIKINYFGIETHSFPIYHLELSKNLYDRRKDIGRFKEWIYKILLNYREQFCFNHTQLITILTELAKNSADHTNKDAFFGLDITFSVEKNRFELGFCFGDLGIGINNNIRNYFAQTKNKRLKHWSHVESYYWALKTGFTSKDEGGNNKGMGMSLVLEGAKAMGLELSVFDAESRGLLHKIENRSHTGMRPFFYDLRNSVGFYYYGRLIAGRNHGINISS